MVIAADERGDIDGKCGEKSEECCKMDFIDQNGNRRNWWRQ